MELLKGLKNVNLVLPDKIIKSSLSIDNGKISSFETDSSITLSDDLYVVPGFIDEHIHGSMGKDMMDGEINSIQSISSLLVKEGVTSFYGTTMTCPEEEISKALKAAALFNKTSKEGAILEGIHLEGPFISPKFNGAQKKENIRKPNPETLSKFQQDAEGLIKIITFAYEEDETKQFIKRCDELGITPSLGHSDCCKELFYEAMNQGLHTVTHLFNAQRKFANRDPGIPGVALSNNNIYTEVIADYKHVSVEALKMTVKCKGPDKVVLISDSTPCKGLKEGESCNFGGQKVTLINGLAMLDDGTIGGSALPINVALRNIKNLDLGLSMPELIRMSTVNPAKNLNVYDRLGSIEVGKDANLVIIDKDFDVKATIVHGEIRYVKEGFSL